MRVLGLETSGRLTGAALAIDGRLAGEMAVDIGAGREEMLLSLAAELLGRHGLAVSQLDRIGVSLGPGSFTGIRVGVAAAQALALGTGVGLVGVPSHEALAYPFAGLDLTIVLLTGIRKGQVFAEAGVWRGEAWTALVPGGSVPLEELPRFLDPVLDPPGRRLLFLGEAVESIRDRLPELFAAGDRIAGGLPVARRPGPVSLLASGSTREPVPTDRLELLQPLYLRGADARKPERPSCTKSSP